MATKMTKTVILYLMICFLAFFLSGCAGPNILSSDVLPRPYQVLEFSSPKSLRLVIVYYIVHGPGNMVDSQEAAVLTERAPNWGENLQPLIDNAPASHLLKGGKVWAHLGRVTEAMTYAAPDRFRSGDPTEPTFWIISIDPPVIAEGTNREDFNTGGHYYNGVALVSSRVARTQDLAAKAIVLYALDKFPPDPGPLSGKEANAWEKSITQSTRRVPLPSPTTLDEIMKNPGLWRSGKTDHE